MEASKSVKFLVSSNIFVSVCAAALAYQTSVRLQLNSKMFTTGIVFCGTLFIYNFHRLIKSEYDFQKTMELYKVQMVFGLMGLGSMMLLLSQSNVNSTFLLLFLGIVTILYSIPFYKFSDGWGTLRTIPFLKSFLIAFVWASMTVLLPVIQNEFSSDSLYLIYFDRYLFILAITIPFDIRDLKKDQLNGIITFPSKLGWKKTLGISKLLIIMLLLFVFYCFAVGETNLQQLMAITLSLTYTWIIVINLHPGRGDLYYSLLLESTSLVQTVLIVLFSRFIIISELIETFTFEF